MISSSHITLRALEPADVEKMYQWENDPSVWPVSGTVVPFSRYTMEQFVTNSQHDIYTSKQLRLAIDKKDHPLISGLTIGYIDLFDFDPSHLRAGVGILIGETGERRKGYARESLQLLSKYAFSTLHLHQLYCHIHADNESSIRLFNAAGFVVSGELKHWSLINGTWKNVFLLQKINPF